MAEQFDFLKTVQDETNLMNLDSEKEPMHIIDENDMEKYTIENIDKLDIHSIAGQELVDNMFYNAYKTLSTMEEYIDIDNLSKNQLKIQSRNLFSILDQYNMLTCYMSVDEGSQDRAFNHDFSRMSGIEARQGFYRVNSLNLRLINEASTNDINNSRNKYLTLLQDSYLITDPETKAVSLADVSKSNSRGSHSYDNTGHNSFEDEFDALGIYELSHSGVRQRTTGGYDEADWGSRTKEAETHLLNLIYEYGSNANDFKLDESSLFDSAYSSINENSISIKEPVSAKHYKDISFDSYELDSGEFDEIADEPEESEEDQLLNNTELYNRARNVVEGFDSLTRERQLEILSIFQYNAELSSENEE